MYTVIYFSPTGNVKHIAGLLTVELGENDVQQLQLDKTDPFTLEKKNHLVLIYPIHGFNIPRTVKRFSKKIKENLFEGVSLIGVGCTDIWVNKASSIRLKKIFRKKGSVIYTDVLIAMPLTFIMSFPDEAAQKLVSRSNDVVRKISQSITSKEISNYKVKFRSRVLNFPGKAESFAARFFGLELHATKKCNSCEICWNNCPENNICRNKKNRPKFGFKCMMCMRCIYNCSQKAITPYISKFIPIKKGYSIQKYIEKKK